MLATYGGIKSRLTNLLGSFFSLFPLGGTSGGIAVRQKGGAAGIELESWHDGTNGFIFNAKPGSGSPVYLATNSASGGSGWLLNGSAFSGYYGGNPVVILQTNTNNPPYVSLSAVGLFGWSSNANAAAAPDTALSRAAAGVIKPTDGAAGAGWLQNTAGEACLSAAFTESAGALTSTNLSITVKAGRSYRIEGILQVSNTTAAEGVQIDFNGGTATATTFFMAAQAVGSVTAGTLTATALNTALTYTVITGTDYVYLRGFLKVNAAGTLVLRAAEVSHATGTLTVGAGSWLALYDTVPL